MTDNKRGKKGKTHKKNGLGKAKRENFDIVHAETGTTFQNVSLYPINRKKCTINRQFFHNGNDYTERNVSQPPNPVFKTFQIIFKLNFPHKRLVIVEDILGSWLQKRDELVDTFAPDTSAILFILILYFACPLGIDFYSA